MPVTTTTTTINPNLSCCISIQASIETYLKYAEAVGLTQAAAVPA
jgi:hypothetical protein